MSRHECREGIGGAHLTLPALSIVLTAVVVASGVSLVGCRPAPETSALQDSPDEAFTDVAALVNGLQRYADTTGALPGSREVLQDFCAKENLPCARLDWSRFSWEKVANGSITIGYERDGYTLPMTMTVDSLSENEPGQIENELKECLRRLLEE
jgi:hypothetical protein